MPVLRINAEGELPRLHSSPRPLDEALSHCRGDGPVIVMIHGYKYRPGTPQNCPHRHILAMHPRDMPWRAPSWPRQMGFGTGHADEGLAIAFGWNARGALWSAQNNATAAGRALARVVREVHRQLPGRPVHLMAHSLGIELAFEALHRLPASAIGRIISMTGAGYRSRALAALETPAGQTAEFVNVTSRENDPFDFLFERLIAPPTRRDIAIGHGLDAANAVTLQLDCASTLDHLGRLGAPIAAPERRICHWSAYTRQGILRFYNSLLRQPGDWSLGALRRGLPQEPAPRWSRLMAMPALPLPLPLPQKAS